MESKASSKPKPRQADTEPTPSTSPTAEKGAILQYHEVTAAAYRIRKGVKETPLEVNKWLDYTSSAVC